MTVGIAGNLLSTADTAAVRVSDAREPVRYVHSVSQLRHLKGKCFTKVDSLPEPDELVDEIIENLEAGLRGFRKAVAGLERA